MAEHLKELRLGVYCCGYPLVCGKPDYGYYNFKDPKYVLDEYGRYMPAVNRFPSAKWI